jgi:hypothetical protein
MALFSIFAQLKHNFKINEITHRYPQQSHGLLICTSISENQGLKKSRSVLNLRKISVLAKLDFFSRSPRRKKGRP